MQRSNKKYFYICWTIYNFSKDVIEESLNMGGWVLHGRALARRTIYVTKSQTYSECGNGVRREKVITSIIAQEADPQHLRFRNVALLSLLARNLIFYLGSRYIHQQRNYLTMATKVY
jgi:hypothetical protein